MKARFFISTFTTLVILFSFSFNVFALTSYNPPERIPCAMNAAGKVKCDSFDRTILIEDAYTADFVVGKNIIFNFVSAGAYFGANEQDFIIFYTFRDLHNKIMRLKSVNPQVKPDFVNGRWIKFKDFYACYGGYMSCPITGF